MLVSRLSFGDTRGISDLLTFHSLAEDLKVFIRRNYLDVFRSDRFWEEHIVRVESKSSRPQWRDHPIE